MTTEVVLERWAQVSIVGLGLIGGSMARVLRRALPQLRVVGIDRDAVVERAQGAGLADQYVSELDAAAVASAFAGSDLVFLATPVSGIRRWLGTALAHGAWVTDCGSTKRDIVLAARETTAPERFVPGHPMAGAGVASAELFEGRPWVLCPEGVAPAALTAVELLVRRVGALPVLMSAAQHDQAVALTSHAPRLIASTLTALVARERALEVAGPAFERLMQGAGGSAEMWRDVLASNADEVARALRLLLPELEACARELESGSGVERCVDTLAAAERARLAYKSAGLQGRGGS